MKKHPAIRWTTLGLVVAVAAGLLYCNLATWFYNPDVFARRAWTLTTTEDLESGTVREQLLAAGPCTSCSTPISTDSSDRSASTSTPSRA
jgi:hypothetical protein